MAHADDRTAMLEIIQSKGEELLRREEEGKTMRLLYESEVHKKAVCPVATTYRPVSAALVANSHCCVGLMLCHAMPCLLSPAVWDSGFALAGLYTYS